MFATVFEEALLAEKYCGEPTYVKSKTEAFVKEFFPAIRHAPKAMGGLSDEEYTIASQKGLAWRFRMLCGLYNELLMQESRDSDPSADSDCLIIGKVRVALHLIYSSMFTCAWAIASVACVDNGKTT